MTSTQRAKTYAPIRPATIFGIAKRQRESMSLEAASAVPWPQPHGRARRGVQRIDRSAHRVIADDLVIRKRGGHGHVRRLPDEVRRHRVVGIDHGPNGSAYSWKCWRCFGRFEIVSFGPTSFQTLARFRLSASRSVCLAGFPELPKRPNVNFC